MWDRALEAIRKDRFAVTSHATDEMEEDKLALTDVLHATTHGEVIESYPGDYPFPSALVLGFTNRKEPVHAVWAYDASESVAILVTVYRPDPARWIEFRQRRRS